MRVLLGVFLAIFVLSGCCCVSNVAYVEPVVTPCSVVTTPVVAPTYYYPAVVGYDYGYNSCYNPYCR